MIAIGFVSASRCEQGLQNVRLKLVNGSSIRATIQAVDSQGVISGSKLLPDVRLDQIRILDTGREIKVPDKGIDLFLRHGSRLTIQDFQMQGETSTVRINQSELPIPLDAIQAIVWRTSTGVAAAIDSPATDMDSVWVSTPHGERVVRGYLESMDTSHLSINYQSETRRIARDKVMAVIPAHLNQTPLKGLRAIVFTTDGGQLAGVLGEFRQGVWAVGITASFQFSIDADQIARIEIDSDRLVYLSDLDPLRSESRVYFAPERPWQRDRSILGNKLRLKNVTTGRVLEFDKGIGTRSYSALVFRNDGKYDYFHAIVGIDAETKGRGDCEMVVEGDGIRLWSQRVRAVDDPHPIAIDIRNINEVSLVVWPGEEFDLADHANWVDARFTKSD